MRALARTVRYAAWRRRDPGSLPQFPDVDLDAARAFVRELLVGTPPGRELSWEESRLLLASVGVALRSEFGDEGVDVVLSVHDDKSFGALVTFGLGGVATELLGDRAYATVPLTTADAADLIAAPRAAPLLDGYGGGPVADRQRLVELALRLSVLADALPEIAECVLGVIAHADAAEVTSAQVWVAPPSARADTGPRRLAGM